MQTQQFKIDLEKFIDSNSFNSVVDLLLEIADEKSQHLLENWQDKNGYYEYQRLCNKIYSLKSTLGKSGINL